MTASVLGLDIGGANLKAAHTSGVASLLPFELWRNPAGLTDALAELVRQFPASPRWAITMTGELCDCFETKEQGVNQILDAVAGVAQDGAVLVWRTDGGFVEIDAARRTPLLTAASNWLALATFAGRYAPTGPAIVVDIGSTTVDLVPLHQGLPIPRGRTDPERLAHQELLYMGVRRTPVCALLGSQVAAEFFATTLDAYVMLGYLPEDPSSRFTADRRPATRAAAHARLARMYCADAVTCSPEQTQALARAVVRRQVLLLKEALTEVSAGLPQMPVTLISAGSGEFLLRAALQDEPPGRAPIVSLAAQLGPDISQAACAYALAVLAQEHTHEAD
jgi:probable H4MPT-linked C1 transfer pathway protein